MKCSVCKQEFESKQDAYVICERLDEIVHVEGEIPAGYYGGDAGEKEQLRNFRLVHGKCAQRELLNVDQYSTWPVPGLLDSTENVIEWLLTLGQMGVQVELVSLAELVRNLLCPNSRMQGT